MLHPVHGQSSDGIDGLRGAISVAVSPHGRHVFVASYADDAVTAFSRNVGSGMLELTDIRRPGNTLFPELLDAARAVTVSPEGRHVFVAVHSSYTKGNFSEWLVTGIETFKADPPADPPDDHLPSEPGDKRR